MSVATVTAAAVAFAPSVTVTTPPSMPPAASTVRTVSAPVQFVAATQPAAGRLVLPNLLVDWLQRIVVPPSASAPFPTPSFPPVIGGNSIDSTIKNVYNAVEPWVRYGFELASYAAGWVPYVGWLAPQVMIFYNFGERIVRSITFNIADLLGGNISFLDGLINVGIDVINSFIHLANDQLAFWLPPLPPIPPIGPFAAAETTLSLASAEVNPSTSTTATTFSRMATDPTEPDPTEPDPTEPDPTEPNPNAANLAVTEANPGEQLTAGVSPRVGENPEVTETPHVTETPENVEDQATTITTGTTNTGTTGTTNTGTTTTGTTGTTTTGTITSTTSNGVSAQGEVRNGNQTVVRGGETSGADPHSGAGRTTPTAPHEPDPKPTTPAAGGEQPDPAVNATPGSETTKGNQSAGEEADANGSAGPPSSGYRAAET
jgi:hypothetical protein